MSESKIALKLRGETGLETHVNWGCCDSVISTPAVAAKGFGGICRVLGVQEVGLHGWELRMGRSFAKPASARPHRCQISPVLNQ